MRFILFALAHSFAEDARAGQPIRVALTTGDGGIGFAMEGAGLAAKGDAWFGVARRSVEALGWRMIEEGDESRRRVQLGPFEKMG